MRAQIDWLGNPQRNLIRKSDFGICILKFFFLFVTKSKQRTHLTVIHSFQIEFKYIR
jgi:hypothetical protein